jgi:hypothetical protein
MKTGQILCVITILLGLGLFLPSALPAAELSGYVGLEGRLFFHKEMFEEQEKDNGSVVIEPEFYHEWNSGHSFTFVPFYRCDSADSRRSHFDIRELNYLWLEEDWELRLGISKVFWGTTEFLHLVDIINQTDMIEHIDEEDKLGQPMAHLSIPRDWGVLDMFVLPWFRERTFPGQKGRLRTGLKIDTDHTRYESGAEEHHVDFAFRYSHTLGNWDFGIYNFTGTSREPSLLLDTNKNGRPILIPYYEQINQTGLDAQWILGDWLWKLEALYRTGQEDGFFAGVGGFEYTFYNLFESQMDLGLVGEYAYDERGEDAMTVYDNDVMGGLRFTPNDADGTEFLVGLIQDLGSRTRAAKIEASRRFGDNWKLSLDVWSFFNIPQEDMFHSIHDDDFLRLQLAYYF